MADFIKQLGEFLARFWNGLYDYICRIEGKEPNKDFYIDTFFPED